MAKGNRGGKRTAPLSKLTDRSEFVWRLAEKGINYGRKESTIKQFMKNNSQIAGYDNLLADVDMRAMEIKIAQTKNVPVILYGDSIPSGYKPIAGRTTAPNGFEWYSNGKSRFSGERKTVLVAIKDFYDFYDEILPF